MPRLDQVHTTFHPKQAPKMVTIETNHIKSLWPFKPFLFQTWRLQSCLSFSSKRMSSWQEVKDKIGITGWRSLCSLTGKVTPIGFRCPVIPSGSQCWISEPKQKNQLPVPWVWAGWQRLRWGTKAMVTIVLVCASVTGCCGLELVEVRPPHCWLIPIRNTLDKMSTPVLPWRKTPLETADGS